MLQPNSKLSTNKKWRSSGTLCLQTNLHWVVLYWDKFGHQIKEESLKLKLTLIYQTPFFFRLINLFLREVVVVVHKIRMIQIVLKEIVKIRHFIQVAVTFFQFPKMNKMFPFHLYTTFFYFSFTSGLPSALTKVSLILVKKELILMTV